MDILRVSLIQTDIAWEDTRANLDRYESILAGLAGKTHLAVFPEMFTTGFSMRVDALAEPVDGLAMTRVKAWATKYNMAVTGSFMAKENGKCFNRAFFAHPDGSIEYYDKRHLFRMGEEGRYFTAGTRRPVIEYKGWRISPQVCYDLRFPVWCRNVSNEYDLLLFVANWPQARAHAWRSLLVARAIENEAYVCGVNRVGTDGASLIYRGDTLAVGAKGEILAEAEPFVEQVVTVELDLPYLKHFREKFPAWKDADDFTLRTGTTPDDE